MAAGATIQFKRKAGAFSNGELAIGEGGVDTTNGDFYFSKDGTTVTQIDVSAISGSISYVGNLQADIAHLAIKQAVDDNVSLYNTPNGAIIRFEDEAQIDAANSSFYHFSASDEWVINREDPHYPDVSLLLDCDGADESTTFTDLSEEEHTVTANGNAEVDTAQSKFGGASLSLDGTNSYLGVPDADSLDMGTGDFTLELWVRPTSGIANFAGVIGKRNALFDAGSWRLAWLTGNALSFLIKNGTELSSAADSVPLDTWTHVAVTRSGSTIKLWIDGVEADSATDTSTMTAGFALEVGRNGSTFYFKGHLDDIRLTKGVARTITVPTETHPGGDTAGNLVLVTEPLSLSASQGAVTIQFYEPDSDVTLNTDITVELSRDDGTTWSTVTLSEYSALSTLTMAGGTVDISSQPSGSNIVARTKTPGATPKRVRIIAIAIQVS